MAKFIGNFPNKKIYWVGLNRTASQTQKKKHYMLSCKLSIDFLIKLV